MDAGADEAAFENWLRRRSNALYTEAKFTGFGETEISDWLALWVKMRRLVTGHGNRWIRERVTALRSHHCIPVYRP